MLTDEFVLIGRKWGCIVMPTINIVNLQRVSDAFRAC